LQARFGARPDPRIDRTKEAACRAWGQAVLGVTQGQVVPIDGKTLRRAHDRGRGKAARHMESAAAQIGLKTVWDIRHLERALHAASELISKPHTPVDGLEIGSKARLSKERSAERLLQKISVLSSATCSLAVVSFAAVVHARHGSSRWVLR
jgi:hypothetical protein